MNNYSFGFLVLIVAIAGYYLLSPLVTSTQLNETSPFDHMDQVTKAEFDKVMSQVSTQTVTMDDTMPQTPVVLSQGLFMPNGHRVAGTAKVIMHNGLRTLRFEDFDTINGPNLHIYLATDSSGKDFIDLGEIKATNGNINYDVPSEINLKKYDHVLVWCVPFGVLFSYADLN